MVISVGQQAMLAFMSIIAGIITGVFFDLYRLIRGIQNPNRVVTFIEDILFWIFTALIVFIFLSVNDYAFISAYVYLCISAGLGFYLLFFSKIFISISHKIFNITGKVLRVTVNIVCLPFELLINYLGINKEIKKKP